MTCLYFRRPIRFLTAQFYKIPKLFKSSKYGWPKKMYSYHVRLYRLYRTEDQQYVPLLFNTNHHYRMLGPFYTQPNPSKQRKST